MLEKSNVRIHFLNAETGEVVLRKFACHAPRVGDGIRAGGEGTEVYYKVVHVVWVYDEPDFNVDRVNIAVIRC